MLGLAPPPLIGALLRVPWETVRDRMLAGLHERGYTDLVAAHLDVWRYPGPENQRPSELATQTRMTKQALNYLLGQLEQLGYLTRETDSNDQRSKRIRLTPRGHAATRAIHEIVREVETEWEQQLGPRKFGATTPTYSRSSTRSPRRRTTSHKGNRSERAANVPAGTRPSGTLPRGSVASPRSDRTHDPADARADAKAGPELKLDLVAQIANRAIAHLAHDVAGTGSPSNVPPPCSPPRPTRTAGAPVTRVHRVL